MYVYYVQGYNGYKFYIGVIQDVQYYYIYYKGLIGVFQWI